LNGVVVGIRRIADRYIPVLTSASYSEGVSLPEQPFDEATYLVLNPDVARAVADGVFNSGFEHWERCGRLEGRLSSVPADFDELTYLELNPDVEAGVLQGTIRSGYEHWINRGLFERRLTCRSETWPENWDEGRYLRLNPDVYAAVRSGQCASGYDHWRASGQYEARPGAAGHYSKATVPGAWPFGLNSFAFHSAAIGHGYAARGYLHELGCLLPTAAVDVPWAPALGASEPDEFHAPYGFNLIHIGPDVLRTFLSRYGTRVLPGRYNIAAWVWELHAAYSDWQSLSGVFNEIWVPSEFVLCAIEPMVKAPVFKIPHIVDELPVPAGIGREFFGWPEDQYVFLYIFDMASSMQRKNPLALIRAFRRAFPGDKDTLLVLKYQHADADPCAASLLERSITGAGNIKLMAESLPEEQVFSLLRLADCFVSPHRGEGFGLNIASAMYYGKPVIVTGYSGNMDYTNAENSFLIDFDLASIGNDVGYYKANYAWASVVEDQFAHLLRFVRTNREEAARRAANGQRTVREMFSRARIRRLIEERVAAWGQEASE